MVEAKLDEHRKLFEEYLTNSKTNSTVINHADLVEIKRYLLSSRDGNTYNISAALKRRIKINKFVLASFPGDVDCVCVLKQVQVSFL